MTVINILNVMFLIVFFFLGFFWVKYLSSFRKNTIKHLLSFAFSFCFAGLFAMLNNNLETADINISNNDIQFLIGTIVIIPILIGIFLGIMPALIGASFGWYLNLAIASGEYLSLAIGIIVIIVGALARHTFIKIKRKRRCHDDLAKWKERILIR